MQPTFFSWKQVEDVVIEGVYILVFWTEKCMFEARKGVTIKGCGNIYCRQSGLHVIVRNNEGAPYVQASARLSVVCSDDHLWEPRKLMGSVGGIFFTFWLGVFIHTVVWHLLTLSDVVKVLFLNSGVHVA
jgi:hypothetical protein